MPPDKALREAENHSWVSFNVETAGQKSAEEQVVELLPGQHGGVDVVGLLSLPVLVHGRADLTFHLYEVVHGVEGQFDVGSLQPNQMVWLRRNWTELRTSKNDNSGRAKGTERATGGNRVWFLKPTRSKSSFGTVSSFETFPWNFFDK